MRIRTAPARATAGPAAELRRRPPQTHACDPGLALMLLAALIESGMSPAAGLRAVAEELGPAAREQVLTVCRGIDAGLSWERAWEQAGASGLEESAALLKESLLACTGSGAPVVPLLLRMAQLHRRLWARTAERQAQQASVAVLLPLTLCYLPAFMLVGVGLFAIALLRGAWSG